MDARTQKQIAAETSLETQKNGWDQVRRLFRKKHRLTQQEKESRDNFLDKLKKLLIDNGFAEADLKKNEASIRITVKNPDPVAKPAYLFADEEGVAVKGEVNEAVIREGLRVMQLQQGGNRIVLANPDKFSESTKILAWKIATEMGITITNYSPPVEVQERFLKVSSVPSFMESPQASDLPVQSEIKVEQTSTNRILEKHNKAFRLHKIVPASQRELFESLWKEEQENMPRYPDADYHIGMGKKPEAYKRKLATMNLGELAIEEEASYLRYQTFCNQAASRIIERMQEKGCDTQWASDPKPARPGDATVAFVGQKWVIASKQLPTPANLN